MDQEMAYLDEVMKVLKKQKEELTNLLSEGKKNVIEIRKEMYEENTKGIQSWDDIYELNAMDAQVNKYGREYGIDYENWKKLMEELDSPYFGRIDFQEDGEETEDVIYIGTYAIKNKKSFRFYVYDWRSPIASMYYEYELGPTEYEAPAGIIKGYISRKRQYKIANGVMKYWFDTDTRIQDEILARTLSEHTDQKLKVIVSSIQKEQNQAIRTTSGEVLYVVGPAGSGKTSVGLHRLAYLLYHNRGKLDARHIVIVANNEIFSSYIANILPELGEEEAGMDVFYDYMKKYIDSEYKTYDFYEMIENVMCTQTRHLGIRLKSSLDFLQALKSFLSSYELQPIPLNDEQDEVVSMEDMAKYIRTCFQEENIKITLAQVGEFIDRSYEEYFQEEKERIREIHYEKSGEYLLDEKFELFCYKEKLRWIAASKERFEQVNGLDAYEMYLSLLEQYTKESEETTEIYQETRKYMGEKILYFEDATAILCILLFLGKIEVNLHIQQVLIDEAQDFNLLQMYFLRNLYPKSKFTILADTNQALEDGFSTKNLEAFQNVFTGKQQLCQLSKSYRSTAPINRFANQLLSEENRMDFIERPGALPCLILSQNFAQRMIEIIKKEQEENNSIGILVYDKSQAEECYELLKDHVEVQLITDSEEELEANLVILPLAYAKGLEFDCVIGAGDFKSEMIHWSHKNSLYLLCTRALHRLYFLSSVGVPPVFEGFEDLMEVRD